jgi:hypothetical protein
MPIFRLSDRRKEILNLLNNHLQLGISTEEQSTLQNAGKIYQAAVALKRPVLHNLGIPKLVLSEIGLEIMKASGTLSVRKLDDEGHAENYFDFQVEGMGG